jgi:transposase, IS5 family
MSLGRKRLKGAQKHVDAQWTKKHGKDRFRYTLHARLDQRYKLVRKIAITHAAISDTNVFEDSLDLKRARWRVHIQRRRHATQGISGPRKRRNRAIATPRAGTERGFGALAHTGGKLVRCLGIVRITFVLQLTAASYNLKRLVFLEEHGLAPF